jgi:hypothetical protein
VTSNFRDSQNFRTLVVTRPTRRFYFVQASHPTLRGDYVPAAGGRLYWLWAVCECVVHCHCTSRTCRHAGARRRCGWRYDLGDGDERERGAGRTGGCRAAPRRAEKGSEGGGPRACARTRAATDGGWVERCVCCPHGHGS